MTGIEIDCAQIAQHFNGKLDVELIKGFVRLTAESSRSAPLDDRRFQGVAIYTATPKQ